MPAVRIEGIHSASVLAHLLACPVSSLTAFPGTSLQPTGLGGLLIRLCLGL